MDGPGERWFRRYEGPALLVFLITAIFMAGVSWWKLENIAAQAATQDTKQQSSVGRITVLETQQHYISQSLDEIKQQLRDIQNELRARH